jgi:hypothetical protein
VETTTAESATPAVKTSTTPSAAAVAATLGESGRCPDESDGRDTCDKSVEQGGFLHFSPSHLMAIGCPEGAQP